MWREMQEVRYGSSHIKTESDSFDILLMESLQKEAKISQKKAQVSTELNFR